jgi:acetylornithine deacetylase
VTRPGGPRVASGSAACDAGRWLTVAVDASASRAERLLAELVGHPSVEGSPAIGSCLESVAVALRASGAELEMPVCDGLPALLARWGSGPPARRLTFSGHVDVVPAAAGWADAFTLVRRAGAFVGRGVADMKGAVAAVATAVQIVRDHGDLESCSFELALTGDEEVGGRRGTAALAGRGLITGAGAVCGEPTDLAVFIGNRGVAELRVVVRGRGGHAGMVHELDDPVPIAVRLAERLGRLPLAARDERFDPPAPALTVTRLDSGGNAGDTVPDAVLLGIDRRLLPGEDLESAVAAVRAVAQDVVGPPFSCSVDLEYFMPPYAIGEDAAIVGQVRAALVACGLPARLGTDLAANDSGWLHVAGIPTVLCGPGRPLDAHTTGERLDIGQLRDAIEVYARLILSTASE